jgi:hypothetical protein
MLFGFYLWAVRIVLPNASHDFAIILWRELRSIQSNTVKRRLHKLDIFLALRLTCGFGHAPIPRFNLAKCNAANPDEALCAVCTSFSHDAGLFMYKRADMIEVYEEANIAH